jgi:hypothetical protein
MTKPSARNHIFSSIDVLKVIYSYAQFEKFSGEDPMTPQKDDGGEHKEREGMENDGIRMGPMSV